MTASADQEQEAALAETDWEPDLSWLTEQLAVGGCFPMEQAAHLARTRGLTAVVDLREEDCDNDELLRSAGLSFLHLPTPDLRAATLPMLDQGVAFAREQMQNGGKVLIHCQHGIGRSPLLALCVMVDQGWEPLDALNRAKDRRALVSPSEAQYRGWVEWLESRGKQSPDFHTYGCIAYRHLAQG
jgi:protein-tyrosine phosphatase